MTLPQLSPRLEALRKKVQAPHGRLAVIIDATASREPMWDLATSLQVSMFEEAAKVGGLAVQLIHYGGDQVQQSGWCSDPHELINRMRTIRCVGGVTQIARALRLVRSETERATACVLIGDAVEETPSALYATVTDLGMPIFLFQEGDNPAMPPEYLSARSPLPPPPTVEEVFRNLARLTGGAYGRFDSGAAKRLGELLRAVAAFAVGGAKALASQNNDSARKLLAQLK